MTAHQGVLQQALEALLPLANAHFPVERARLDDDDAIAADVAVTALRAELTRMQGVAEVGDTVLPEHFATIHDDGYWNVNKKGPHGYNHVPAGWPSVKVYTEEQVRQLLASSRVTAPAIKVGTIGHVAPPRFGPMTDLMRSKMFGGCPECGRSDCAARSCSNRVTAPAQAVPPIPEALDADLQRRKDYEAGYHFGFDRGLAQPVQPALLPVGLIEVMREASNIISEIDRAHAPANIRWPISDELDGFAQMLADAQPLQPKDNTK